MDTQHEAGEFWSQSQWSRWLLNSVCILMLVVIGVAEHVTRDHVAVALFYLIPIALATWFTSACAGRAFTIVAASVVLVQTAELRPLGEQFVHAGARLLFGFVFVSLLSFMRTRRLSFPVMHSIGRMMIFALTCAGAVTAIAWKLHGEVNIDSRAASGSVQSEVSTVRSTDNEDALADLNPNTVLASLAARLDESISASRPVLLGSRDPNGPSCVNVVATGQVQNEVPGNVGDIDGGPGTTMGMLYYYDRLKNKSPLRDFSWHQTRLKTYLQNQVSINRKTGELVHRFTEEARKFLELTDSWIAVPEDLSPIGFNSETDWPSYCLSSLDSAIRARDLNATRRWAAELHSAAFAIEDLHRWAQFLCENQLIALDFQQRCESLFNAVEGLKKPYDPQQSISQFPAGVLCMNGISNYYEVERQAETLYATPKALPADQANFSEQSIAVSPDIRAVYSELRSVLGPHNQASWDLSAKSPFHHGYLVNMLYRSKQVNTVAEMRAALKKFDSIYPNATPGELMGALMYRGHSFAGLEWADRFQNDLVNAGNDISLAKSDPEALMEACRWTNKFYKPDNYGSTLTLRDAIEQKKLDCVRATDMIGAIFRNAGRTRFGNVRWSSETMGHSVAAYLGTDRDNPQTLIVDGLNPTSQPEIWPDAYYNGHEWPANLANNPTPYSVELYGRGIDGYIWLEGYIIRGPNAGYLTKAAVPYSATRRETTTAKVYNGPYPR